MRYNNEFNNLKVVPYDRGLRQRRRLVFYSDMYPPEIRSIVDNPVCSQTNAPIGITIKCAFVSVKVCVILEEGDEPLLVRSALLAGFKNAIQSGKFEAAIPPENIPSP